MFRDLELLLIHFVLFLGVWTCHTAAVMIKVAVFLPRMRLCRAGRGAFFYLLLVTVCLVVVVVLCDGLVPLLVMMPWT